MLNGVLETSIPELAPASSLRPPNSIIVEMALKQDVGADFALLFLLAPILYILPVYQLSSSKL
jgi:hypothetical protein